MLQEIFYWFIASFVAAGFWFVGVLMAGLGQRRKSRRIQQGIAAYLLHKTAARE
jgi:hypothetical protein